MITRYYQEELARLKELGAEFAEKHPALAPMLGGPSADPDVERLLEGTAFQTALLRRKLDDDFPELIHDMVRLVAPHYLRPVPATTIVAFEPKSSLAQSRTIPAGTELASVPVEGTRCLFRTTSPVELHPLELTKATFTQPAGKAPAITLSLTLRDITLADWRPHSLRLFCAGEFTQSTELFLILSRHLKQIILVPEEGGTPTILPSSCLQPAGFTGNEPLIPWPPHAFPGFRLLQEYFVAPHRFLFLELTGWERWASRGDGSRFTVSFELEGLRIPTHVTRDSFALFATPAVNLFSRDAEPILLDHRRERYLIRPEGMPPEHAQVHSVDRVTGFNRGTNTTRDYAPFEQFTEPTGSRPVYHTSASPSPFRPGVDVHLAVSRARGEAPAENETLSIRLTCTDASLPQALRIGDLCVPTGSTPACARFRNILPVSAPLLPPLGKNRLWRLLSHLSASHLPLAGAPNLRKTLSLYLFDGQDQATLAANQRRIEGIEELAAQPVDRLIGGAPVRGEDVRLSIRRDHFAGPGDLFLFCSVLDEFIRSCTMINSFTRLTVRETMRGEEYRWPARIGQKPLI
ncbi:type VI secretion system baseplate subunit TssF [Geobacter sp.]|uniref:type VI secretion system baseplate subunit TssF n=1 Tax=Geobacter sp. TaxID=46610 RepID=UPI00263A3B42|nr:type VI secretion system baseplate subunit TssF [Geobacter sp.]